MNKTLVLLMLLSTVLHAEPAANITPQQVLANILVQAPITVNIDQWQQSPLRLGASQLKTNSETAGNESELNLSMSWNSPQNRHYLASLEHSINQRQLLSFNYQKWQLAGELRREWANLARLKTLQEFQNSQIQKLEAVLLNVRAAFAAKEITRMELLLVENALTEAAHQGSVTEQQFDFALQAYAQLSGQRQWPQNWQESARADDWQHHPLLLLQHLDVQLAENTYSRDSSIGSDPWQTNFIVRKTQGVGALPDDTAVGVQFSLPIGTSSATEQAALAQQQMHIQQNLLADVTRQVRLKWFDAKASMKSNEIAMKSAHEQWARGQQIQSVADAAIANREITHTEWLRLFLHNQELAQKAKLAEINYAASIAELNQAGGLTW